jgi:protein PhnA
MTIEQTLLQRCDAKCELCSSGDHLSVYQVPLDSDGTTGETADQSIMICDTCRGQIEQQQELDVNHWRCLSDSMWSPTPAVQVMAWRLLTRLSAEAWAQDLLDMLYLDDDLKQWAEAGALTDDAHDASPTLDSNGTVLNTGDTVTLIKDLDVKGAGFTAKRGTAVRNISLTDNPEQIEGRVNGVRIVLLTCFLKKSN